MKKFRKAWLFGYRRIIKRRAPHTWLSWRFVLPVGHVADTPEFKLHRKVFFHAWRELPRIVYAALVIVSTPYWYVWAGPQAYRRLRKRIAKSDESAPVLFAQKGLFHSKEYKQSERQAIARGVSAQSFSVLKLYQIPTEQWWQYVPNDLLPHWHRTWQGPVSNAVADIMANKRTFAEFMGEHNLPVVSSVPLIPDHQAWQKMLSDPAPDWFLKPEVASQAKGCLILTLNQDQQVVLRSKDGAIELLEETDIEHYLREAFVAQRYLLQPRLVNHPLLEAHGVEGDLVVFRVVTLRMTSGEILVWRANMEAPLARNVAVEFHRVDVVTGVIADLDKLCVPYWPELRDVVSRAHTEVTELHSVGWDLAITAQGPVLIEGNINWGTNPMQGKGHGPLLDEHYLQVINEI
ncbi:MAG: hypothetical protein JJU03_04545 [Idiomarina sp.]|nr:hypothetical protein [Idiomarina sp.]